MLVAVDAVVQLEKEWIAAGVNVELKPAKNQRLDSQISTGTYKIAHDQ